MRYYLDHASTTWPKPPGVLESLVAYQSSCGAASGRGVYRSSLEASAIVQATRRSFQQLINAESPDDIAFCSNGTHALNVAIFGLALAFQNSPMHVVTTTTEHNSVLRPLAMAAERSWLSWTAVACDAQGFVDPADLEANIQPNTKLIVLNHASNVTGALQDVESVSRIAKRNGCWLMLDAAQTIGYIPIDVRRQGIDLLACPGHKGLCGMLGTGLLYAHQDCQSSMVPLMIGGTGEASDRIDGDFPWQSAIESGNLNVPSLASLQAGMEWKQKQGEFKYLPWIEQILAVIETCGRLRLIGPTQPQNRLPVFSLAAKGNSSASLFSSPQEMATFLDSAFQLEARAGFHCAGLIHGCLGTQESGGTLRLSLGATSTQSDVDAACEAIQQLDHMMQET